MSWYSQNTHKKAKNHVANIMKCVKKKPKMSSNIESKMLEV
jgi:hypothetical protein